MPGGPAAAEGSLYAFWLFILYRLLLSALFALALARLPRLDPLPVPRKLLFAHLVLPGLLLALLGYAGAHLIRTEAASRLPLVDYRQHPVVGDWDVQVPLISWEIGWDSQPAPVEEPYYPWSVSLFRGLPPVLYSPYHAPQGSPPKQVAKQLSRAVQAAYGTSIPATEIQRRYLALALRGGYTSADASRRPWGPFLLAGFGLVCVLGTLWSRGAGWTAEWKLAALTGILGRKLAALLPTNLRLQWGIVVVLLGRRIW
jgi:hypothetical protein